MQSTIVIRVDSSSLIGAGHVMRCLTLANELREKGHQIVFIARELPGNLNDLIAQQGFLLHRLSYAQIRPQFFTSSNPYAFWLEETWETDAAQTNKILMTFEKIDLLILDHYALDASWESAVKSSVKKIMVIDDLANRPHQCDLLLDQSLYPNQIERYQRWVSKNCILLFGAEYALLRKEFFELRKNSAPRTGDVKRILIFLGGADSKNVTQKIIEACVHLGADSIEYDVVVGKGNAHREIIKAICAELPNFHYHCQVSNMGELMQQADLCIGAGGSATWERCSLGLPAMLVSIGAHDEKYSQSFAEAGAVKYLGKGTDLDKVFIANQLQEMLSNKKMREKISQTAFDLIDGLGVDRVVQQMGAIL